MPNVVTNRIEKWANSTYFCRTPVNFYWLQDVGCNGRFPQDFACLVADRLRVILPSGLNRNSVSPGFKSRVAVSGLEFVDAHDARSKLDFLEKALLRHPPFGFSHFSIAESDSG